MDTANKVPTLDLKDDLLDGVDAIAVELGVPKRRAQYLVERKLIPCGKLGRGVISTRSALQRRVADIVSDGVNDREESDG